MQVGQWSEGTKRRMKYVRDESVIRVIDIMQTPVTMGGNMPVATGFLWSSGQVTIGSPVPLVPHPGGTSYAWDANANFSLVRGAPLDAVITFSYGANYAAFQNYGTRRQQGHLFLELALQQWNQIVEQVAHEAMSMELV